MCICITYRCSYFQEIRSTQADIITTSLRDVWIGVTNVSSRSARSVWNLLVSFTQGIFGNDPTKSLVIIIPATPGNPSIPIHSLRLAPVRKFHGISYWGRDIPQNQADHMIQIALVEYGDDGLGNRQKQLEHGIYMSHLLKSNSTATEQ